MAFLWPENAAFSSHCYSTRKSQGCLNALLRAPLKSQLPTAERVPKIKGSQANCKRIPGNYCSLPAHRVHRNTGKKGTSMEKLPSRDAQGSASPSRINRDFLLQRNPQTKSTSSLPIPPTPSLAAGDGTARKCGLERGK